MQALALILKPNLGGWAVYLTDGHRLVQFRGPWAHARALHYLGAAGAHI